LKLYWEDFGVAFKLIGKIFCGWPIFGGRNPEKEKLHILGVVCETSFWIKSINTEGWDAKV
jgi:hypothetical protein